MRRDEAEDHPTDFENSGVTGLLLGLCRYQSEPEGFGSLEDSAEISYTFRGGIVLIGGFVFRYKGPEPSGHDKDSVSFCLDVLLDACLDFAETDCVRSIVVAL